MGCSVNGWTRCHLSGGHMSKSVLRTHDRVAVLAVLATLSLVACGRVTRTDQPSGGGGVPSPQVALAVQALSSGCTAVSDAGRDYLFCTTKSSWATAQN